ncbi:MAG: hypothetical protein JSS41_04645 [Proteobacteria bacterium]|nr:hypothetical protein [Pseudomonadota bacterium]
MSLFSFQGKIYIADRQPNGQPGPLRWAFNVPQLQIKLGTTVKEHKESFSGQRLEDARLITEVKAEVSMDLEDFDPQNLAMALYGSAASVAAASVTAEALPTVAVGDIVKLAQVGVSTVVVTDSAGTPATLVAGTDYAIESAAGGLLKILNLGSYVQPFNVAYAHAGATNVAMFTTQATNKYLVGDLINTVDNSRVLVRLYQVRFDPLSQLDVIGNDFNKMTLAGSCLADLVNGADPTLGYFGRIEAGV